MIVFLNLDHADCAAQVDRAEERTREVLSECGYDGAGAPVVRGSASGAVRGDAQDWLALVDLADALDETVQRR